MADDVPKPSPSRGSNRLHALGKLTALLGLPLLVIGGLFGGGLWFGATHAYRISSLEAEYLGMAAPEGATWTPPSALPPSAAAAPAPDSAGETGGGEAPDKPEPVAKPDKPEPVATPNKPEPVEPPAKPDKPEPVETPATTSAGLMIAAASPVGPELRAQFDAPLVVRVKVLVDPGLAVAREDWLTYVAEVVAATDASFEQMFGVELRLQGIVMWDAVPSLDAEAALEDLRRRERDGADVVLGLLARAEPAGFRGPIFVDNANGDHDLVFADLERDDRYYQNMLRTLAAILGAEPSTDAAAPGSFMSPSGTPEGRPPTIDPGNRGKVIINKRRPFLDSQPNSEGEGEGEGDESGREI